MYCNNDKFAKLFGAPACKPDSTVTQREMDIARSILVVTEEIVLKICNTVHKELKIDYLCMAGGVALNCVSNGRVLREGPFKDIWIQPAAGDAGGAIGAALTTWYEYLEKPRQVNGSDFMFGSYLGPRHTNEDIVKYLSSVNADYKQLDDAELMPKLAEILDGDNVVGWFQGRMEFGPRSLGGRSIIGDARSQKMQSTMNLKIKYRESFRPFAPVVMAEHVSDWFEIDRRSSYMLLVAPVKEDKRIEMSVEQEQLFGIDKLNIPRSEIPAVTHVDYSARVQTVHEDTNPRFYNLLDEFNKRTDCPVLVNTSFNVRGEPIVCTPEDAYRCFMRTEMDYLVLENVLIAKTDQPEWKEEGDWRDEFALDKVIIMDIPEQDNAGLRKFGLTTGAIIVVLFVLFFPWVFDMERMPMWPWILAGALWLTALLVPSVLRQVYTTWMKIGHGLGWFNSRIILGILFYVMILPMGLVMRLFGNDPMARKKDASATTYRKESISEPRERLEKPY